MIQRATEAQKAEKELEGFLNRAEENLKKMESRVLADMRRERTIELRDQSVITLIKKIEKDMAEVETFIDKMVRYLEMFKAMGTGSNYAREVAEARMERFGKPLLNEANAMKAKIKPRLKAIRDEIQYVAQVLNKVEANQAVEAIDETRIQEWVIKTGRIMEAAENLAEKIINERELELREVS